MKTAREILTEYCELNGYPTSDDSLLESLTEATIVHEQGHDEHRWYIVKTSIAQVSDSFIAYTDYIITGDASMSDMDLRYDLDEAKVVERKERVITEAYYE